MIVLSKQPVEWTKIFYVWSAFPNLGLLQVHWATIPISTNYHAETDDL